MKINEYLHRRKLSRIYYSMFRTNFQRLPFEYSTFFKKSLFHISNLNQLLRTRRISFKMQKKVRENNQIEATGIDCSRIPSRFGHFANSRDVTAAVCGSQFRAVRASLAFFLRFNSTNRPFRVTSLTSSRVVAKGTCNRS